VNGNAATCGLSPLNRMLLAFSDDDQPPPAVLDHEGQNLRAVV